MIWGGTEDDPGIQKDVAKVRRNPDKRPRLITGHPSICTHFPKDGSRKSWTEPVHLDDYRAEVEVVNAVGGDKLDKLTGALSLSMSHTHAVLS